MLTFFLFRPSSALVRPPFAAWSHPSPLAYLVRSLSGSSCRCRPWKANCPNRWVADRSAEVVEEVW